MAYFACINKDNIVVSMKKIPDSQQHRGHDFITQDIGWPCPVSGRWIQCSYNTRKGKHKFGGKPFRKNYPLLGYSYDPVLDAFISPKPESCPSWVLDTETCTWVPPIPKPSKGNTAWNESSQSWEAIDPGPAPFPSWTINSDTGTWTAPVPLPELPTPENRFKLWDWSEETLSWIEPTDPITLANQTHMLTSYEASQKKQALGLQPTISNFRNGHIDMGYLTTLHPELSTKLVSAYN